MYDTSKINAFQCDITQDDLTSHIIPNSVDIVTIIFVLSSISPEKIIGALQSIASVSKQKLRPNSKYVTP